MLWASGEEQVCKGESNNLTKKVMEDVQARENVCLQSTSYTLGDI